MSEEEQSPDTKPASTRTRSPNYPMMPLGEAIGRIKQVYDREHTHKASPEVVADALGYAGLNGTSRMVISTLRKYGLLQKDGDSMRVSALAVDILELPHDNPNWTEAISKAAFTPSLFQELKDTFGENLPSDANLRYHLIKKSFNPKIAVEVIQMYKDTMNLVYKEETADLEGDVVPVSEPRTPQEQATQASSVTSPSTPTDKHIAAANSPALLGASSQQQFSAAAGSILPPIGTPSGEGFSEALRYRISANSRAHVLFEGTVTQEAIEKLIAHLQLSIDDFPSNQDLLPPQNTQQPASEMPRIGPAVWKNKDVDLPVIVKGEAGEKDGRTYLWVEGSEEGKQTGVPADEVEFDS